MAVKFVRLWENRLHTRGVVHRFQTDITSGGIVKHIPSYFFPEKALTHLLSRQILPSVIPSDKWNEVVETARVNGLAPMLIHRVHESAPALLDDPMWKPLLKEARYVAFHSAQLEAMQTEIDLALSAAGITPIWLKGIALAQTIYPEAGLRPMSDVDVLVPFERREEARDALLAAGYREADRAPKLLDDLSLETGHHYRLTKAYQRGIVELHYRLLGGGDQVVSAEAERWIRAEALQTTFGWRCLSPEAQLLHLCIHNVLAHFDKDVPLVRYFDIDLLIRRSTLDWEKVLYRASEFDWIPALRYALEKVIGLFSTPVPDAALQQLHTLAEENNSPLLILDRRGSRTAGVLRLFQGVPKREWLVLIRRLLLPPAEYMRRRYPEGMRLPLWRLYLIRWSSQSADVVDWVRAHIGRDKR